MRCKKVLRWYELIPLFSFFLLKGKCGECKTRISWQYPTVEFLSALIFAGLFLKFENIFYINTIAFSISYSYYAMMFSLLMIIAVYDLRHKIIPDILSIIFAMFSFVGLFLFYNFNFFPHIPGIWEFLSGLMLALPFALIWILSKGTWMGLGDAKLAVGLGWLIGFSRILSGAVVAFWSGAVIGILLILFSKRHGIKSEIPFAPFLVLGVVSAFLFELRFFPF